jgi:hypothetical protein
MLPPYTPVIGVGVESQVPTYLPNSDVNYIEFFNSATQVVANRVARVDITYSGDDPTVETWKFYDQDGTSIVRTVVITHTFVANDLTNSVQVPA